MKYYRPKTTHFSSAMSLIVFAAIAACGQPIFSQESLRPVLIGSIPIGAQPGQLAFTVKNQEIRNWVPPSFSFTPAGVLAIHDAGNYRIEYFDAETLAYKYSERANFSASTDYVYYGRGVMWDVNYNYTKLNSPNNSGGKELDNSQGYPFAYRNGLLWFSTSDKRVYAYDETGKILEGNQAKMLMLQWNADFFASTGIQSTIKEKVREQILGGKVLIVDGTIVPRSFSEAMDYFRVLNPTGVELPDNHVAGGLIKEGAPGTWSYGNNVAADGTTVWVLPSAERRGNNPQNLYFCAYSPSGKLLAYVDIAKALDFSRIVEEKKSGQRKPDEGVIYSHPPLIEVSPRGDIYILAAYFDEVRIYRVRRVW